MNEEELRQNIFMNENENGYDYVKRINTQYTKNGLYQNVGRVINILQQQLKDKDEKISKIYEIKKDILTRYKLQDGNDKSREFYYMQCIDLILNILESNKED